MPGLMRDTKDVTLWALVDRGVPGMRGGGLARGERTGPGSTGLRGEIRELGLGMRSGVDGPLRLLAMEDMHDGF